MNRLTFLQQKIISKISVFPHSRVHALNSFKFPLARCLVKREDELGFGISGSKWRKYISLIPYLLEMNYEEVVIIGSAFSNNVLGLSQLLIENRIKPTLFLLESSHAKPEGNLLLTSLLVPESQMQWITRRNWQHVEECAFRYAQKNSQRTLVVPEGACIDAALPGALTLALDIIKNEKKGKLKFQNIFMDAGTGLSSIATILALTYLKKAFFIHVILLAGSEDQFMLQLKQFQKYFELLMEQDIKFDDIQNNFKLYKPAIAGSFGSTNNTIFKYIKALARDEGFFTDPIYSAKFFWEAKNIISKQGLKGDILLIHSGGALTLMGFQNKLYQTLNQSS